MKEVVYILAFDCYGVPIPPAISSIKSSKSSSCLIGRLGTDISCFCVLTYGVYLSNSSSSQPFDYCYYIFGF